MSTALVVVACSVQGSNDLETIDAADVPLSLADTTTTTTTTTIATTLPTTTTTPETVPTTLPPTTTTTTIPTEKVDLYFITGSRLSKIERELEIKSPETVLAALQAGPSSSAASAGLETLMPKADEFELTVTVSPGAAVVNVPASFLDLGEPAKLAFGQIVLTLVEIGRIGGVTFEADGVAIQAIRGDGSSAPPGQPVYFDDYQELLTIS